MKKLFQNNSIINFINLNILKLLLINLGIDTILSLIRLWIGPLGINIDFFGILANSTNFIFFLIVIIGLIFSQKLSRTDTNICILSCFILIWCTCIGIIHYGVTIESIKHLYMIIFPAAFIVLGRRLSHELLNIGKFKFMFNIIFYLNLISTFLFIILSLYTPIYPGYGTQSAGYLTLYYATFGKPIFFFASFILVILQGKRSILVSILCALVILKLLKQGLSAGLALFISILATSLLFIVFLFSLELFQLNEVPGLDRIKYINPFSQSFNIALGSSGRFDEITSAFSTFASNDFHWIYGTGLGFQYEWTVTYGSFYSEIKGYLHNTPLLFIILGGIPLFLIVYGMFIHIFIKTNSLMGFLKSKKNKDSLQFLSISFLFFLISGLFSLNSLSDPVGWIFLGACLGAKKTNATKEKS